MPATAGTITSLTALAEQTLAIAAASLDETAAGAPDLQYMEAGPLPAWDCCPALFVIAGPIREELTSPLAPSGVTGQRASFGRINLVTLTTVVLRCAANPDAQGNVTSDAKTAVATTVQQDGWALWTGFYRAILNNEYEGLCTIVRFDFGQPLEEQGGCVGWEQVMHVELGGIPK